MGQGGRKVSVGVMKYFRHILMGHEVFFKIFDGRQKSFLMSYFGNFIFLVKGHVTQNIKTSYQGDLRKTSHVK